MNLLGMNLLGMNPLGIDRLGLFGMPPDELVATLNWLQALSTALAEGPYALAHTSKRIHELCLDAHVSVSRPDIHALLRALLFNGFDPTTSPTSFDDLVATTCGVALAACEREGMTISDADRAALLGWVVSEQEKHDV